MTRWHWWHHAAASPTPSQPAGPTPATRAPLEATVSTSSNIIETVTPLPAITSGTVDATGGPVRRFDPNTYAELPPITDGQLHTLLFDASVFLAPPSETPHGHYYRTTTRPPVLLLASLVSLAPAPPPPQFDSWAGQPAIASEAAQLTFGQEHGALIDAAYARFLVAADAWLTRNGESSGEGEGVARGGIPRDAAIAIAASVDASILRVAGYFGPEPNADGTPGTFTA